MSNAEHTFTHLQCRDISIPIRSGALLMGVLNVTPDSFSDGGKFLDPGRAVEHVHEMIAEGADIIDVGGESTRPGARYVGEKEEIQRIKPVMNALGKEIDVPISIDTRKAAVAEMALDLGAALVNDVSGLRDDPQLVHTVQKTGAGVIIMHRKGSSETMQQAPYYEDVMGEVLEFLTQQVDFALINGISAEKILIDPGIGFGKTATHNIELLANIGKLRQLGYPIVVGLSRKSFLGELTKQPMDQREIGHAASLALMVWEGAHILRVHNVGAMKDALRVAQALRNAKKS